MIIIKMKRLKMRKIEKMNIAMLRIQKHLKTQKIDIKTFRGNLNNDSIRKTFSEYYQIKNNLKNQFTKEIDDNIHLSIFSLQENLYNRKKLTLQEKKDNIRNNIKNIDLLVNCN